ncbi:MAG: mechanosensitive ion channel [Crocinitomicaceae bacterium]|nr:mechanosensitive ion channel [Crocinitomicaceae bacterium]
MTWDDLIAQEIPLFGNAVITVGDLMWGVLVILVTWTIVRMAKRAIMKPRFIMDKIDSKRRLSVFLISKYIIWVIGIATSVKMMGGNITVLLFGSTALLVGIGLGFQNIFKDLISGIFLLFEGTIKVGDIIEADGVIGKVCEINLRSTEVLTRDDVAIIIPNSKFVVEKVVNWSHDNEEVRFMVNVSVAYGSDVEKVFLCLEEAMSQNAHILSAPKAFVRFNNFGESALEFVMIFWSKETFVIENIKSDLRRDAYKKLSEHGLSIPFPQRDIHIKGVEHMVDFKQKEKNN